MAIEKGLEDRLARNLVWKGDCLEWTGTTHKGYGRIYDGTAVKKRVHRVVYSIIYGYIPNNLEIRHTCDNPPCCNPEHLIAGTHKENMEDMSNRDRVIALKGEEHPKTKLTEKDILKIRDSSLRQRQLALDYGVHYATISNIIRRKTWKHL